MTPQKESKKLWKQIHLDQIFLKEIDKVYINQYRKIAFILACIDIWIHKIFRFDIVNIHIKLKNDAAFHYICRAERYQLYNDLISDIYKEISPYLKHLKSQCLSNLYMELEINDILKIRWNEDNGILQGQFIDIMPLSVKCYLGTLVELMKNTLHHSEKQIRKLEVLNAENKKAILAIAETCEADCNNGQTLIDSFLKTANLHAQNIALTEISEGNIRDYTYDKIRRQSEIITSFLYSKGVRHGHTVAIVSNIPFNQITCILGILQIGAAFLPIPFDDPAERIYHKLTESGTVAVLTDTQSYLVLPAISIPVYLVTDIAIQPNVKFIRKPRLKDPGYIIYTSGSSGKPKGVCISHSGIKNYFTWRNETYKYESHDIIVQLLSYEFDGFYSNLFSSLILGSRLLMFTYNCRQRYLFVSRAINTFRVTSMSVVPTILKLVMQYVSYPVESVKNIILGGDIFTEDLLQDIHTKYPNARIFNEYGPSENCIASTCKIDVRPGQTNNIGKPIKGTKAYILNKDLGVLPQGVIGDIYVTGPGLTRGYIGDNPQPYDHFITNPFHEGERLYDTGDLGYLDQSGDIIFSGRRDRQIKINGCRIDPKEIEFCLESKNGIKQAVVIQTVDGRENAYLCVFYESVTEFEEAELRSYLEKKLPIRMIPSKFYKVDEMPVLPNGKIDYRVLQSSVKKDNVKIHVLEQEHIILQICSKIFRKKVVISDHFFDIGGNSIHVIKFINQIEQELNIKINVREVFQNPLIKDLIKVVDEKRARYKD